MLGPEPTLFGKPKFSCMRLHYRRKGSSGYFHTLRAVIRSPEEDGKGTKKEKGNYSDRLVTVHCLGHWLELTLCSCLVLKEVTWVPRLFPPILKRQQTWTTPFMDAVLMPPSH